MNRWLWVPIVIGLGMAVVVLTITARLWWDSRDDRPTASPGTYTSAPTAIERDWDELCRGLEGDFMKVAAPDRRAHADKLLRELATTDTWETLSVDDRRATEDAVERALAGDC